MAEAAQRWWRGSRGFELWFIVAALLPGATLFALLLWLSQRYVREGFGHVRQFAFAPDGGKSVLAAPAKRNWWSCTCANLAACASRCAIARGVRRCCDALLPKPLYPDLRVLAGAARPTRGRTTSAQHA